MVYEHLAAVLESFLQSADTFCLGNPSARKAWRVLLATKPRTPTSNVSNFGFQEVFLVMLSRSAKYLPSFLTHAAGIPLLDTQFNQKHLVKLD